PGRYRPARDAPGLAGWKGRSARKPPPRRSASPSHRVRRGRDAVTSPRRSAAAQRKPPPSTIADVGGAPSRGHPEPRPRTAGCRVAFPILPYQVNSRAAPAATMATSRRRCPMTEAGWMSLDEPRMMLELLRGKSMARKMRLLALACCRRVWDRLDERSRLGVE